MPPFSRSALFTASAAAALYALTAAPLAAFAQEPAKVYDVKAEAVLQKAADRLLAARSLSGKMQSITYLPASGQNPARELRSSRTFRLQKPNRVYQQMETQTKNAAGRWVTTPTTKLVSDGKTGAMLYVDAKGVKTYRKLGVSTAALLDGYSLNFPEFFDPKISDAQSAREGKASGELVSLRLAPDAQWGGVTCSVVEEKSVVGKNQSGKTLYSSVKIYVGKDGIIRGYHTVSPTGSTGEALRISDETLTNVAVGSKIPASVFAVNLSGYKEFVAPKAPERPALLAAGMMAPDFTAYDKDGTAVKLSDLKGKIVVLDFWATWCGPCMRSLPHTTDVAKAAADKGVVVLAVNVWDKKEEFDKWLPAHPEFSPLRFVIDTTPGEGQDVATKLYKVSGIPTQYVIDREGRIVTSFVGFGGPTDDLKNAIAKADAGSAVAQK